MADNIIIKITSEADLTAAQKQLQDMEAAAYDLTKQMADLKKAEAEEIKALEAKIKKSQEAIASHKKYIEENKLAAKAAEQFNQKIADEKKKIEDANKAIDAARKKHKDLIMAKKDEIKANKQSITEYNKQIKSYKLLHGEGGRMVLQLRAMREELQRMEDAGQFGTKAFVELAKSAAALEDQIGDTQTRIRVLASDTLALDTAMSVADGLAGGFYVATSAAELFGSDMEKLQEAFYKVQAAMSTLTGIQQVANALNKESVAMIVFGTSMEKIQQKYKQKSIALERLMNIQKLKGVAADGAKVASTSMLTKAQWKLNAAMSANPLGVIIGVILAAVAAVAALGVGLVKLTERFSAAGRAAAQYRKIMKEVEKTSRDVDHKNSVLARSITMRERLLEEQYRIEMNAAKKKNASETEILEIEQKYAKKREELNAYRYKQLENAEQKKLELEKAVKKKQEVLSKLGLNQDKKKEEVKKELKEIQDQLLDAENEYYDILQAIIGAEQEVIDNEIEMAAKRKDLNDQIEQSEINLMSYGYEKEAAQIKLEFQQRLDAIQGNSAEEQALRLLLLAEQEAALTAARKKYAAERANAEAKEAANNLERSQQSTSLTEELYAQQTQLAIDAVEKEAKAKIAALDKTNMSTKAYNAEVEAIELEKARKIKEINDQLAEHIANIQKNTTEEIVMLAEEATKTIGSAKTMQEQKDVWKEYYDARKQQIEENRDLEIEAIERSTATLEEKKAQKKLIIAKYNAEINAINREAAEKNLEIETLAIDRLRRNAEEAERALAASEGSGGKLQALKDNLNAQNLLYDAQLDHLKSQYEAGLISYQEYKNQEWEITKAIADAEAQYVQDKMQTITDALTTAIGYMQEISDMAFEAIANNIQAEMDRLDEMYTTDAEEAQKNANKRYMSEKEFADKKAALEMKQAKYAKTQALINAAINTASAIVSTLAQLGATPWGIASAAIAAAMGATQIGIIAAKPLAQYEKGRKGGQGEYALVGEKGPEIMYIPAGASIVPNNKIDNPSSWMEYGVPTLQIPANVNMNNDALKSAVMMQTMNIDYDRFGKSVADHMPAHRSVNVSVDRRGVSINEDGNRRTYLNTKYNGSWS